MRLTLFRERVNDMKCPGALKKNASGFESESEDRWRFDGTRRRDENKEKRESERRFSGEGGGGGVVWQRVGGKKTTSSQAECVQTSGATGWWWHSRAEKIQQRLTDLQTQKQMGEVGSGHVTRVQ